MLGFTWIARILALQQLQFSEWEAAQRAPAIYSSARSVYSPERQLKTGDRQDQLPLEARMVFILFRRAGVPQKDPLDTQEVFCNDLGPDFFWSGQKLFLRMDCAWIAHGLRVDWPPDLETLTDRSEMKNDAECTQNQLWRPILRPIRATSISGGGPARISSGCLGFGRHFDALGHCHAS